MNIIVDLNYLSLQELNSRAQGEVSIRDALRELDLWGAGAVFSLTSYKDTNSKELQLIKDWRDLFNQVINSREFISHSITVNVPINTHFQIKALSQLTPPKT